MEMEEFLSREADSVRASIDGKGYQRAEYGNDAVHVGGGQPFPTDMEAMERKLARQRKLLLKERIYKLFYNKGGEVRWFSAFVTGIFAIITGMGFFYGVGRIAELIFKISDCPQDCLSIAFMGFVSVLLLAIISGLSMIIGRCVLDAIKKFIKS